MDLDEIRAFLAVAGGNSRADAARRLGIPRSTLNRRLDALEAALGAPLLARDGPVTVLTAVGRLLADRGRHVVAEADALEQDLVRLIARPEGVITLLLPVGMHSLAAALVLVGTCAMHPEIRFEVRMLEDPVRHLADDGDLAIHFGPSVPEGPWRTRAATRMPVRLCARPTYLDAAGRPTCLEDLHEHAVYGWIGPGLDGSTLPLRDGGTFELNLAIASRDFTIGGEAARVGAGIALVPNARLPDDGWPSEEVEVVLEELVGLDTGMWLVAAERLTERPALGAVVDQIGAFITATGIRVDTT